MGGAFVPLMPILVEVFVVDNLMLIQSLFFHFFLWQM